MFLFLTEGSEEILEADRNGHRRYEDREDVGRKVRKGVRE